jgi:tRNA threonylcarbamoyladenosine biosynthesis protein TsaB
MEGDDDGVRLLREVDLIGPQRTAQSLAPALRDLLRSAGWKADQVELVAVVIGPGSFTGLRIGVTTAKTLAYAVGAEVVGVDTLSVLAAQAPVDGAPLWAIVDAQRQELFAAKMVNSVGPIPKGASETHIVPVTDWLAGLAAGDRVTGPALKRLHERLPDGVHAVAEEYWQPTAGGAGRLAWSLYQQGHRDDLWKLTPLYLRLSAAEEKAARSEKRGASNH